MTTQENRILFWGIWWGLDCAVTAHYLGENHATMGLLFVLGVLSAWLAASIGHSNWQSPSKYNYAIMGCITTLMLAIMLIPLILINPDFAFLIPLGLTGILAAALSYTNFFQSRTLNLFGTSLCVPGDSSWQEFLIGGLPFGLAAFTLFYLR